MDTGKLYLGKEIFQGESELEILRSILNLCGQPDKHVLDNGNYTTEYFKIDHANSVSGHLKLMGNIERNLEMKSVEQRRIWHRLII